MKKLVYVLLGLFALYIVLCLVGKADVKVERSTTINAPVNTVKSKIADLKLFHDAWSPWTEKDPGMKTTYTGETGQPGSSMSWQSDKKEVGKGTMTYVATSGDSVLETLHFDGMGDAKVYFIVTPDGSGSKVTWAMENHVGFMARGFMLFMNMDKMVGGDFEKGLARLKVTLESMSVYKIDEISWGERTYIGKKELLTFDKLQSFFAENLPKIGAYIGENKLELEGYPAGIFFTYDAQKKETECAAVFGIKNAKDIKGWEKFTIAPSKVLKVAYYGPYEAVGTAHNAIATYMKEKNMTQSMVIEEYVTDPMSEKDPSKWLTNIYYVIK
jgi:effector-binding domain-containing protein/carbon monoxide dehydrogenase subunit G